MASRRKRKRERRLSDAQETGRRGDRTLPPAGGKGGAFAGIWAGASRSDLALLRRAVREGWPVPEERCPGIVEELERLFADTSPRKLIALAWVFLEMDRANLGLGKDRGGTNATG